MLFKLKECDCNLLTEQMLGDQFWTWVLKVLIQSVDSILIIAHFTTERVDQKL